MRSNKFYEFEPEKNSVKRIFSEREKNSMGPREGEVMNEKDILCII